MSHLVEHDGRTYPLGRLNDTVKDPRNRDYPALTAAGPLKPVRWKRYGPALTQRVGSCTGEALAEWFDTAPNYKGGKLKTQKDAEAFYSAATQIDGVRGAWPPDDTGSTGPAVCKAAKRAGLIGGYTHAFGIGHFLAALQLGPVMVGTVWLDGMFTPDVQGVVTPSGDEVGGHEYVGVGYDPVTRMIEFLQSWGPDWGLDGHWWMHRAPFAELLQDGGDVTVPSRVAVQ